MNKYESVLNKWQSFNITSKSELNIHLDSFRILFAYNSGKIENNEITYHDTREIFKNGKVVGYTGSPKALFEQQNQKICYDFLLEKIISKEPLSINLILETHRVLTEGTYDEVRYLERNERPGTFKKHDYVTGINEVGSAPSDVESDLAELIDEVNSIGKKNPLMAGAYFHARFENIHPFADGNGRVGRTLLNYWMMICDYPPLIIYDENKTDYYMALEKYDELEDISALVEVIKNQTIKTWEKSMQISQNKNTPKKGLDSFI